MKNQSILILVLLFSSIYLTGQSNSGTVIYSKEYNRSVFDKESDKNTSQVQLDRYKELEEKMKEISKSLRYEFNFKDNEALFQVQNLLEIEGKRFVKAAIGPEASGKFYYSIKNVTWSVNAFGEDFIVSKEKPKWILKSEEKKIGNYNCRKAILEIKTNKNSITRIISAWYCPQINIPYGPIGYYGLPGLILELDLGGEIKYYASKITINPKEKIEVKKPTKGKEVTEEEFNNIGKKIMQNFKKNNGF